DPAHAACSPPPGPPPPAPGPSAVSSLACAGSALPVAPGPPADAGPAAGAGPERRPATAPASAAPSRSPVGHRLPPAGARPGRNPRPPTPPVRRLPRGDRPAQAFAYLARPAATRRGGPERTRGSPTEGRGNSRRFGPGKPALPAPRP